MLRKIIQLILGHLIFTLGIALIVKADLGVGAWDTVYLGLQAYLGGTYGTYSFVIQSLLIFINALILWERPDIRSIVSVIMAATMIDFWLEIVFSDLTITAMELQIPLFVLGSILLSFGIAFYIQTKMFNSPFDGLMIATSRKLKMSLGNARLLNEFAAIGLGAGLLGGPFGVTTFILSFFLGYLIQFFYKLLENKFPIKQENYALPNHPLPNN